jgi:glutamate synthase domain-containing protein 3
MLIEQPVRFCQMKYQKNIKQMVCRKIPFILNLLVPAGQSFGAFNTKGVTLELEGDANDYFGKD